MRGDCVELRKLGVWCLFLCCFCYACLLICSFVAGAVMCAVNCKNGRVKRASRIRYKLRKVADGRMRLTIFRSNRYLYVQVIDDARGVTLASASTMGPLCDAVCDGAGQKNRCNKKCALLLGAEIAKRAKAMDVSRVVFDRGGYKYHGCIKVVAETAREAGLDF